MRIDIATLFPQMCEAFLSESIVGRARKSKKVALYTHNIRDYTLDKHKCVDDAPYGGGMGMLLQAEPVFRCYQAVVEQLDVLPHVVYLSPQGSVLTQKKALDLSRLDHLFLLCGHYEGIDQRVLDEIVDEELSIGDYVLTGGELPALVLVDSVVRLCEGVLPSSSCFEQDSIFHGLLEHPQFTRPEYWRGKGVPEVLLSGHHKRIAEWKRKMSLKNTLDKRPDLLSQARLSEEDLQILQQIIKEKLDLYSLDEE